MPKNLELPADPFTQTRNELASRMKAKRAYEPHHHLRQFLEFDRKVLRFQCLWDDTNNTYGDVHKMEIHYYLSDDTIEIREEIPQGSRKPHSQVFLGRCKLPKRAVGLSTSITQPAHVDYYTDKDFFIGTVVHLYGRPFVICDCDEFTKFFYQEKYGVEEFFPIREEDLADSQNQGIGAPRTYFSQTHDDAVIEQPIQSVKNIDEGINAQQTHHSQEKEGVMNKQLNQTVEKSLVSIIGQGIIAPKSRLSQKFDGVALCFSATKKSKDEYDTSRQFIINVFVFDGSVSVFERKRVEDHQVESFLKREGLESIQRQSIIVLGISWLGRLLTFMDISLRFLRRMRRRECFARRILNSIVECFFCVDEARVDEIVINKDE